MSVLILMGMLIAHFFKLIEHAQKSEYALCLLGYPSIWNVKNASNIPNLSRNDQTHIISRRHMIEIYPHLLVER